jgi:hypothetical protein
MAARMSNNGTKKDMSDIANKRREGVSKAINKMAEEIEQIDEISLKTKMRAYSAASQPDADANYGDKVYKQADRLKSSIVKKHGEKAGEHADTKAHTDAYGRSEPGKTSSDYFKKDKLKDAKPASAMRTTKAGMINKQDVASKKNEIKSRLAKEEVEQIDEGPFSSGALKPSQAMLDAINKIPGKSTVVLRDKKGSYTQHNTRDANGKVTYGPKIYHNKEEVEIDEARERTDTYLGTYKSPEEAKEKHGKNLRIRARLGKDNPNKSLYAKGGPLKRRSSQDIKPEHGTRFDAYTRKTTKEEVEFSADEIARIEAIAKDME